MHFRKGYTIKRMWTFCPHLLQTVKDSLREAVALDILELLTNSEIVQTNLFQICCLLKNGKKKDAWRRHPIYFIIRFKLIAVAERRQ